MLDFAAAFVVGVTVLWLALSSSLLLTVHEIHYDYETEELTLVRSVPWTLDVSVRMEVVDVDGQTCPRNVRIPFEPLATDTARVAAPWVKPCRDRHPVTLRASYQVHLLGLIPLRPTTIKTILPGGPYDGDTMEGGGATASR
jgi:hypothetical protein